MSRNVRLFVALAVAITAMPLSLQKLRALTTASLYFVEAGLSVAGPLLPGSARPVCTERPIGSGTRRRRR